MDSYLVLLRVGFTLPHLLPDARCALTAPFHPYLDPRRGGFLSAALSVSSHSPGVTWRSDPLEPGLSSALGVQRPSNQLAVTIALSRPLLKLRADALIYSDINS